ncbi:MAG: insulinase family protein, partial [Muribaculaceae bacterium]|nr:insulinase family protein [Muribaculaceae bacterium]
VYTVESNVSLLSDAGTMSVYFGTDPRSVDKCLAIIRKEIDRLAQNRLTDTSFRRIRDQYLGQMIVGTEQRESNCMSLAKSLLYYGEVFDIRSATERMREVTAEDLRETAMTIISNGLNRLTLK